MEKTLEEAFAKMIVRVKAETGRIDQRFAPLSSEPQPGALQPVQPPPPPVSLQPPPQAPQQPVAVQPPPVVSLPSVLPRPVGLAPLPSPPHPQEAH